MLTIVARWTAPRRLSGRRMYAPPSVVCGDYGDCELSRSEYSVPPCTIGSPKDVPHHTHAPPLGLPSVQYSLSVGKRKSSAQFVYVRLSEWLG